MFIFKLGFDDTEFHWIAARSEQEARVEFEDINDDPPQSCHQMSDDEIDTTQVAESDEDEHPTGTSVSLREIVGNLSVDENAYLVCTSEPF